MDVKASDVIVLGAGMVGVSAALHLLKRGRTVTLVDRRGVAEETSYGNAGLIQTEAIVPYAFPRDPAKLARYALGQLPEASYHFGALPGLVPALYQYWRDSTPEKLAEAAKAWKPLANRCLAEHEALMREAGVESVVRRSGYLRLFRTSEPLEDALVVDRHNFEMYGINFKHVSASELHTMEPHLTGTFTGAILMPDAASVPDPGAVGRAYGELFQRLGGVLVRGEARTLERDGDAWRVLGEHGPVRAREVVIALGPWSADVLERFGVNVPLFVKRGYHMHFKAKGNATLERPVLDTAGGYVLAPMTKGIRLTTGAEFADRDAPPTPVQLELVEPMARGIFPLEHRVDPEPWLGRRPCLPDMLPMIGSVPGQSGLWADFGHQHWGFTTGPVCGHLLADMMTGGEPFTDPRPYRVDRFS
jgi:D-amino-acid dehydrogenase